MPASEDGAPRRIEDQDNSFVKKHSEVGAAELANVN